MSPYTLRPARTEDIADLRRIEVAAGEHFRALGMDLVADDDPPSAAELTRYIDSDRAWVVVAEDQPVGYLTYDPVDGPWHIEQVSVEPRHAGHGLGRRLIDQVAELAAAAGVRALTLTTYRDVPWNAPYYERLGFGILPEPQWTPGLRALRKREAAHGLDAWPRVCMRRELPITRFG